MPVTTEPTLSTEGAAKVAQRRLQSLADGLGDLDLQDEMDLAARLLRAELPTLPPYDDLDADHRAWYDVAVGLGAAIALLGPAISLAHNGMSKIKEGDTEYAFVVPDLAERKRWAEEVAQAVGYLVNLVRGAEPPPRPRPAFSMFGAAGVARQRTRRQRGLGEAAQEVVRLIVPDGWVYTGWFEGGIVL